MEVVVAVILVCADKIVVPAIVMNIYTTLTHCKIEYIHQFCVANKNRLVRMLPASIMQDCFLSYVS